MRALLLIPVRRTAIASARLVAAALVLSLAAGAAPPPQQSSPPPVAQQQKSFVIVGADVADGSGEPLVHENVRVAGDRITRVGNFAPEPGEDVVHADGLVLAPGFIDTHNHSGSGLETDRLAESQISQGLTTLLLGQDGSSPWPIGEWLEKFRKEPAALNVMMLVGHATLRRLVMGDDFRRPATLEEIAKMAGLVEQGMSEGAVGLSSGLEYEVGSYSTTEEVVAMARVAGRDGGFYISHIRDEADRSFEAMRELLQIGREAGLPVQNTHIKLGTVGVWYRAAEVATMYDAARHAGQDVTADCYPYEAWHSNFKVLVPNKKYEDPASVSKAIDDVGGPQNLLITDFEPHPEYQGHTLAEAAKTRGITPTQLLIEIIREGDGGVIGHTMTEQDMRVFYAQPWVMVSSDGGIGMKHPRAAGTFPRVLGRLVREWHWLTLPEAVRRMTSLPAWRLKLSDRGLVKEGMVADLTLFNPQTVIDRSTFQEPQKLSEGIEKVYVSGVLVWDHDHATGAKPGKVLPK
ncbi:MAG TPA: D-aminoacylase [Patescibacteria group bacterium]|nr:D-aminoacylase [Patescibacteria group bacterium]